MPTKGFEDWTMERCAQHNARVACQKAIRSAAESTCQTYDPVPAKTVPAPKKGTQLNKTERRWLAVLESRGFANIGIQNVTLHLGFDCRYTPDFFTAPPLNDLPTQLQPIFWEVKGFMRGDAQVKIAVAARMHNWAKFILVRWVKGQWVETVVRP